MYLGNQPTIGAYHKLDAISTVNGQATYNLLLDGNAFSPQSANHMLVVVNGIVQSPTTNFNISGSTIVFTSNLVTGDVINEIRVFGDVLNIGTVSDGVITDSKCNFVSTSSAAGLSIKGDGTTDGTVQLNCSQNSHGVKIASPAHSAGQSYTIKLPTENIAADKIMKVASITGSGTSAVGQMSFVDAPTGSHTLLGTTTASSSANVTFTSSTFTGFDVYMIEGIIIQPATDNVKLRLRVAGADGTIDTGSIYTYAAKGLSASSSDVDNGNGSVTEYYPFGDAVTTGNEADEGLSFRMWVYGVADSSVFTQFHTHGISLGSDYCITMSSAANIFEANTTTKIQFDFSSGNIAAGKFKIYGVS